MLRYATYQEDALRKATVSGLYLPRYSGWRDPSIAPEHAAEWLRNDEPVSAVIRAWCGAPAEREFDRNRAYRAEIARLRKLVTASADFLEAHGHPHQAKRILKALNAAATGEPEDGAG